MDFIDNIKYTYRTSSMLMRVIFINVAVFVLLIVLILAIQLFHHGSPDVLNWVACPGDWHLLLHYPWTLVTYMFSHNHVLHILFNLLWLYWLGRIFMEFFSAKQLMGLYLLGGWGGALLYILAYNLLPGATITGERLIGASASIIAIVVAIAVYTPNYKVGLLFLGEVSIKWIVIVLVAFVMLGLSGGSVGDNVAHVGGAIVGALFTLCIRQGHDITRPLNAAIDAVAGLFNGRSFKLPQFKRERQRPARPRTRQGRAQHDAAQRSTDTVSEEELDEILKKIKAAGYDALTDAERDKLFKVSRGGNR